MMTRKEAAEYAPQWGSYMTSSDPGACMYGLDSLGRPANEFSRDAMIAHIDEHCLPIAADGIANGDSEFADDVEKLEALKTYLATFTFPEPHTTGEPSTINGHDVAEFMRHYIIAMLWSTNDESDPETGGEPLDSNYDESDIAPAAMAGIEEDCRAFLEKAGDLITDENYIGRSSEGIVQQAGHDFWLTRAGHGCGFWDGDWKSDADSIDNRPLTELVKEFGGCDPYVGDDGMIYI